jgi:hypothetical protein
MSRESLTWPSTLGYVTTSNYAAPKGGGKAVADLRFNYVVGGHTFEGRRAQYGSFSQGSTITHEFRVGPARVYYSPQDPSEAVLRPGLAPATYEVLVLLIAIGAVPGVYLLWRAGAEMKNAL